MLGRSQSLFSQKVQCVGIAEDNVPRLAQIFDAYAKILRRPSFLKENGITDPQVAAKFIYKVCIFLLF